MGSSLDLEENQPKDSRVHTLLSKYTSDMKTPLRLENKFEMSMASQQKRSLEKGKYQFNPLGKDYSTLATIAFLYTTIRNRHGYQKKKEEGR